MDFISTALNNVFIIKPKRFNDERGQFIKTFHKDIFQDNGIDFNCEEVYFSTSKKDVLRGMHFQVPPYDHAKVVYVIEGSIIDVVLDIRTKSSSYGQFISVNLSSDNNNIIYIPAGCAHGFLALEDNSKVVYLQSSIHNAEADSGINWKSFGMNWNIEKPIISERDKKLINFNDFISPF